MIATRRTFARVPATQTTYSTMILTKPNPETVVGTGTVPFIWMNDPDLDNFSGTDGYIVNYNSCVFTKGREVYIEKAATCVGTPAATGGSRTITYNGSTTAALTYDATEATIAAAVNGLASVISEGLTFVVTLDAYFIGFWQFDATAGQPAYKFTTTSSITPALASTDLIQKFSATRQFIYCAGRLTVNSHGFVATNSLYTRRTGSSPAALVFRPGSWSVVDANTVAIRLRGGSVYSDIVVAGAPLRDYTAGTARVRVKQTQTFYLPGVTSGIATVADIPIPETNTGDRELLTLAASATTGFRTYDATRLERWRESPIYEQTVTSIDVGNL